MDNSYKIQSEEYTLEYIQGKYNNLKKLALELDFIIDQSNELHKRTLIKVYEYFAEKITNYSIRIEASKVRLRKLKEQKKVKFINYL